MDYGITGKVALVTGGSRGIGRSTARLFAREGAHVCITYHRQDDAAHAVVDELISAGTAACANRLDLRDDDSIQSTVDTIIARWGRIDILVNNAVHWIAPGPAPLFENHPPNEWRALIRANVEGPYRLTQAVLPFMKQNGWGRIVNVSSTAAADGVGGLAWYSASKAALHGLTFELSNELGPSGILVNAVMPGATLSESVVESIAPIKLTLEAQRLAIRRVPVPDEVASLIAYLCSAANTAVTGEVIRASGGRRR